jgi:hypothetical protein
VNLLYEIENKIVATFLSDITYRTVSTIAIYFEQKLENNQSLKVEI